MSPWLNNGTIQLVYGSFQLDLAGKISTTLSNPGYTGCFQSDLKLSQALCGSRN
jgi:hypothetical protein